MTASDPSPTWPGRLPGSLCQQLHGLVLHSREDPFPQPPGYSRGKGASLLHGSFPPCNLAGIGSVHVRERLHFCSCSQKPGEMEPLCHAAPSWAGSLAWAGSTGQRGSVSLPSHPPPRPNRLPALIEVSWWGEGSWGEGPHWPLTGNRLLPQPPVGHARATPGCRLQPVRSGSKPPATRQHAHSVLS